MVKLLCVGLLPVRSMNKMAMLVCPYTEHIIRSVQGTSIYIPIDICCELDAASSVCVTFKLWCLGLMHMGTSVCSHTASRTGTQALLSTVVMQMVSPRCKACRGKYLQTYRVQIDMLQFLSLRFVCKINLRMKVEAYGLFDSLIITPYKAKP